MPSPAPPTASPWEFAPMNEPEVWRQDVPEEKQAVVERAFDTATRGISSFLDHARFGRSPDADAGLPFKATTSLSARPKHGGAIACSRSRRGRACVGENGHLRRRGRVRAPRSTDRGGPAVIFGAYYVPVLRLGRGPVRRTQRFCYRWDPFCRSAEVRRAQPRVRRGAAGVLPEAALLRREQWLICAGRRLKNGGSLFVSASLPDAWVPPPATAPRALAPAVRRALRPAPRERLRRGRRGLQEATPRQRSLGSSRSWGPLDYAMFNSPVVTNGVSRRSRSTARRSRTTESTRLCARRRRW